MRKEQISQHYATLQMLHWHADGNGAGQSHRHASRNRNAQQNTDDYKVDTKQNGTGVAGVTAAHHSVAQASEDIIPTRMLCKSKHVDSPLCILCNAAHSCHIHHKEATAWPSLPRQYCTAFYTNHRWSALDSMHAHLQIVANPKKTNTPPHNAIGKYRMNAKLRSVQRIRFRFWYSRIAQGTG